MLSFSNVRLFMYMYMRLYVPYTNTSTYMYMYIYMYFMYYWINLCKEAVYEDGFGLSEAVAPEHSLQVVGGVPTGVKYDHSVGSHQIDP